MINSLKNNIASWEKIAASSIVLQWIRFGVPLVFQGCAPHQFMFSNPKFSVKEIQFIRSELHDLLACGAIREVDSKPWCVSPIRCVPKKRNKLRLITDLRQVNSFVTAPKFQHDGINVVAEYISFKDSMITLDLEKGFHHVPVNPDYWKYLGFQFDKKFYVWCVLPFGLCCSPYYFHKVLRPVVTFFRSQNIKCSIYVDDCIVASPKESIIDHRDFVIQTFEELGFAINYDKSSTVPASKVTYIGYVIDSIGPQDQPWLFMERSKIHKLKKDLRRCLQAGAVCARLLAKIAGQAVSMSKAILPGKLKLRSLYTLLATKSSWSDILNLNFGCARDLNWWLQQVDTWNGSPLKLPSVDTQLWTDASDSGWGCYMNGVSASGTWDQWAGSQHINYRELLTVLLALKSYGPMIQGRHIQVLTDSTTAAAYVNNMGGPVQQLTSLAETIWTEALERNFIISCRHVAGKLNTIADQLSRLPTQYEWQLNPCLFKTIDRLWGPHTIDRFASFSTTQLRVYNSRFLDPGTSGVDALAQTDWGAHNNFVNAPFRLLDRILDLIIAQRAWTTIIAPKWIGQVWFAKMKSILMSPPFRVPTSPYSMKLMGNIAEPLKNKRWKLFAWRVYGGKNFVT